MERFSLYGVTPNRRDPDHRYLTSIIVVIYQYSARSIPPSAPNPLYLYPQTPCLVCIPHKIKQTKPFSSSIQPSNIKVYRFPERLPIVLLLRRL